MKILAFSDIHQNKKVAREIVESSVKADVIIGAGDFATCGQGASDTIDILKMASIPVIIVPGNHDNIAELKSLCDNWPLGYFLHGDSVEIDRFVFLGLGGEIPARNNAHWNESLSEKTAEEILSNSQNYDVLITHTPPLGHVDVEEDGIHDGSEAILHAIEKQQPKLNLCGHMHFSWGQSSQVRKTEIYNLGPRLNWFEL